MNNPLTLIRKLDASTPPAIRQQRQNPRRERRAVLKAIEKAAKVNAKK
jgi:hypothetical protein